MAGFGLGSLLYQFDDTAHLIDADFVTGVFTGKPDCGRGPFDKFPGNTDDGAPGADSGPVLGDEVKVSIAIEANRVQEAPAK